MDTLPRKKILIVNFYYPPTERFGGAVRWQSFLKYLPEYGWEPLLLCCRETNEKAEHPNVIKIRPYVRINKPFRIIQWGWIMPLYRRLVELIERERFPIVALSGPPMWYLMTVHLMRKRFPGLKIVLDFRDPWYGSPNVHEKIGPVEKSVKALIGSHLEKGVVNNADLLTVVSPGMMSIYSERYPLMGRRLRLLPNGFEIPQMAPPAAAQGPHFTLAYAGSFESNQDPTCIYKAVSRLRNHDIKICFIGSFGTQWQKTAAAMGVQNRLEFTGALPHEEALRRMNQAHAFILLVPPTKGTSHAISGKTYEYLHLGKPIVVISTPGDPSDLVKRHSLHSRFIHDYDPRAIAEAVDGLYDLWKAGKDLSYSNIDGFDDLYSRRALTGKLSGMLNEL